MSRKDTYRLSEEIRYFIINEKLKNSHHKVIKETLARKFHRSIAYSTIRNTWDRYLRTGSIAYEKRAGRPRALTSREERSLVREFLTQPGKSIKSTVKLQDQHPIGGKHVSRQTVRRVLRRRGLRPRISKRGTEIKPINRVKRVKFAQNHANWTIKEWSRIVFSDESKLYPKRTVTRVIWSRSHQKRSPPFEEPLEEMSINVWGYIRYDGVVEIFRFEDTMKQDKYIGMLENHIDDALKPMRNQRTPLNFMQDNASYHKANDVIKWLRENVQNFITWPSQSPDLSPMENVWAALKNELWNRREHIRSPNDVWRLSREIVRNFTLAFIHSLYNSLPERMESVIKNKGNRINY